MGASRKLQGEIDRVLKKVQEGVDVFDSIWNKVYDTDNANQKEKFEADLKKEIKKLQRYRDQIKTWIQSSEIKDKKVSASYEQALMDARKQIEREMERFKICEKETKTKAFSKEGLGQQPKTDPKEKAKSETRDWLNNVVGELESQIDSFEAEIEGLSVKKGKTRPPRLTHLETSIVRHKAHIMKLELILRLLDNDGLSPEQVNDVRDFLEDYVERNQEDFEEFSDVDELYSSLPLDKVESLEDLVAIGPPALVKGVAATNAVLSMKTPLTLSQSQQGASNQQQEETASQDSNSDIISKTPPPKSSAVGSSGPPTPTGNNSSGTVVSSSPGNLPTSVKEEESLSFPVRKSSPAISESGSRGIGRGGLSSLPTSVPLSSGSSIPSNGALGTASLVSEMTKRNILGTDERLGSNGMVQPLGSPLSNRMMLPQTAKTNDGNSSVDGGSTGEPTTMASRVFSTSVVPGVQWRPGSSFQNQNEAGHLRGRTEIEPDQREKYLQRFQQVQQQGQGTLLGLQTLAGGNHKQFSAPQQNPLLQQFNSQSSSISQVDLGVGVQAAGSSAVASSASLHQHPTVIHQSSTAQALISSEVGPIKSEELLLQQTHSDDSAIESAAGSAMGKHLLIEDDLKTCYTLESPQTISSSTFSESVQLPKDTDLSSGQLLQSNQSTGSLGFIGRRSISDLGAIGDSVGVSPVNSGGSIFQHYHQMNLLEAAFFKIPHPKDSERARSYNPKHPAVTPSSYPQVQASIVNSPSFWERLGADNSGTDTLFFTFYFQQNTYQQYLAAKELKKQAWRYHRKHNTWFQRHEEPKFANDDYEQGSYIYFDFHIDNEEPLGWCQRLRTGFKFEYNYLEDELLV